MSMSVVWSVHHVYIAHYVCLYTLRLFPLSLLALGWPCFATWSDSILGGPRCLKYTTIRILVGMNEDHEGQWPTSG